MGEVVSGLLHMYSLLVFVRVMITWVQHDPYNPIIAFLYKVTDPYLDIFRSILPATGGMDISPILALILLQILASAASRM